MLDAEATDNIRYYDRFHMGLLKDQYAKKKKIHWK